MKQYNIFLKREANNWFKRNKHAILTEYDIVLQTALNAKIAPKNILDIGCATGGRLDLFYQKFKSHCYGIDPSKDAIAFGSKNYPNLKLFQGSSDDLSEFKDNFFDLIIISGTFELIDRKKLFQTIAEIDRVLQNKKYLIISSFFPYLPSKVKYHHLPKLNIYTYKQPYWDIFLSSHLYNLKYLLELSYDDLASMKNAVPGIQKKNLQLHDRWGIALLQKNLEDMYLTVNKLHHG